MTRWSRFFTSIAFVPSIDEILYTGIHTSFVGTYRSNEEILKKTLENTEGNT